MHRRFGFVQREYHFDDTTMLAMIERNMGVRPFQRSIENSVMPLDLLHVTIFGVRKIFARIAPLRAVIAPSNIPKPIGNPQLTKRR